MTETFEVPISLDGAPDRYTLEVDLYELDTMIRLKLSQGGDALALGQVRVTP